MLINMIQATHLLMMKYYAKLLVMRLLIPQRNMMIFTKNLRQISMIQTLTSKNICIKLLTILKVYHQIIEFMESKNK